MNRSVAGMVLAVGISAAAAAAADDGQGKPPGPAEEYRALVKELQAASDASSSARLTKVSRAFLELAEKNPTDPIAVDALIQVVRFQNGTAYPAGKESPGGRALAILLRDHVRSDKLGEVCGAIAFGFRKEYETFLRTVMEMNPHKEVQGMALLSLAQFFNNRWQRLELAKDQPDLAKRHEGLFGKDYVEELKRQDGGKVVKEIEGLFEQAAAKYGDVKLVAVWAGEEAKTVGEKAETELFQIRRLSVGREAPDIEGEDQDGKRFKLSDYRGKVLLLDFWNQY